MLDVTVCVVVYNAIENIQQCLDSLMAQDYPTHHMELLFIDNNSTDGTKELLQYYDEHYAHVRTVINPVRGIAGSRNLGLKRARFDYIAFTDSDCVAPSHWLSTLVAGFEKYVREEPNLAAVGGSNVPPRDGGLFYNTLDIMLNTYLGSHSSVQGRRFERDRYVPHIPTVNILYHKPTVLNAGGFDVTFGNIGEDQDLSFRLQKLGHPLVYLTECDVVHKMRPTWKAWLRNMFTYGKGRMWLMRKHTDKIDLILLGPLLLTLSMIAPFFAFVNPIFLAPLLYVPVVLIISLSEAARVRKPLYAPLLFALYAGTHFAYGFGELIGLVKNREFSRLETSQSLVVKAKNH